MSGSPITFKGQHPERNYFNFNNRFNLFIMFTQSSNLFWILLVSHF